MKTKIHFILVLVCFMVLICSTSWSDSDKLTRPKAAEIIKKHFPLKITTRLPVGYQNLEKGYIKADYYGMENEQLITKVGPYRQSMGITGDEYYVIKFTEKGKKYVIKIDDGLRISDHKSLVAEVIMCYEHFAEVSGILKTGYSTARVEFTTKYVNGTPFFSFWKSFKRGGRSAFPLDKPREHAAKFELYDDGWRLKRLE